MAKRFQQRISLLREQTGQSRAVKTARVANQNTGFTSTCPLAEPAKKGIYKNIYKNISKLSVCGCHDGLLIFRKPVCFSTLLATRIDFERRNSNQLS